MDGCFECVRCGMATWLCAVMSSSLLRIALDGSEVAV